MTFFWYAFSLLICQGLHRVTGFYNHGHLLLSMVPSLGAKFDRNDRGEFASGDDSRDVASDDSMRKMLESSWNRIKMGRVPIDVEAAAEESYSSIMKASVGESKPDAIPFEDGAAHNPGVFFVDLLLPTYDKSQQKQDKTSLYDEVKAVQYCISLANCFKGKTEIIVRDVSVINTVQTVLNARERNRMDIRGQSDCDRKIKTGYEQDMDDTVLENDYSQSDSIRKKLMMSWDNDDSSTITPDNQSQLPTSPLPSKKDKSKYRLASLFGNTRIKIGPDMANSVIQAVRNNALAQDDEDVIIVLNSIGKDEMIAVRGLVTKYVDTKKIILVNCKLHPTPKELLSAETVYSVLPLTAKRNYGDNKINNANIKTPDPKVVVLRRYPNDWEIFVDVGSGYELAETVPINETNKRGLSMELIGRATARHLDFTSRR